MKKIILLFAILNLVCNFTYSQLIIDTNAIGTCGYDPSFINDSTGRLNKIGNFTPQSLPKSSYTNPAAIEICGKFRLFYEDIQITPNFPLGFNHPSDGATRRATLCAVYQYIQSVFTFTNVTGFIDIEIQQSTEPPGLCPISPKLAAGTPLYVNLSSPGIKNGNFFDHMRNGVSPLPSGFDAELYVDFCGGGFKFYNPATGPVNSCEWDLFTILLHEVGHQMGFATFITETGSPNYFPVSSNALHPNVFTNFDSKFIFRGDPSGSPIPMQQIVIPPSTFPSINPALVSTSSAIRDMRLWLKVNTTNTATPGRYDNLPIYSGIYLPSFPTPPYSYSAVATPGSLASHIDGELFSFTQRFSKLPGFNKLFVMQPYAAPGRAIREFTEQEIRIFTALGYTLNPVYAISNSICSCTTTNQMLLNNNRPPYTTRKVTNPALGTATDEAYPDLGQTIDYSINAGSSLIINLATLPSTLIADPDGDPIRIENGTLYNIRGCGNGGNNHSSLTVNSTSTQITYTPRTNFFGRAQFGFYLHDGKERGSFIIFTINVLNSSGFINTPNVNTPIGQPELVLNGDYEEGVELKRNVSVIEESINGNEFRYNKEEGKYFQGAYLADAHPLNYVGLSSFQIDYGMFIGGTSQICNPPTLLPPSLGATIRYQYGNHFMTFPHPFTGNPTPVSGGYRYSSVHGNHNYQSLSKPLAKCKRYVLKMDLYPHPAMIIGNTYTFNCQFEAGFSYTTTIPLQTLPVTFVAQANWQTITVPFWYCSNTGANYLNFTEVFGKTFFDNVSLTEDLSPPPLTLTATASANSVCIGSNTVTLTASSTNSACAATYTWNPGGLSGASPTVAPTTTTTYTVVMNDGCRTATATTQINVSTSTPPLTLTASSSTACIGSTVTLNASGATTYTWNPGNITTNPFTYTLGTTSTFTAIGLLTGCVNSSSATINVGIINPIITVASNPAFGLCPGFSTATLTANGANTYTFTDGSTIYPTNPIVVSPSSTTIYTVTGTHASGCVATSTFALNVSSVCPCPSLSGLLPAVITTTTFINTGSYAVNQNVTINGNVLLANVELLVSPGVSITVTGSSTLTINRSHIYACGDMWQGIKVDPNAQLKLDEVLIEDAISAVIANNPSGSGTILDIEQCVFNRNFTGITIRNYTLPNPTYPFKIRKCIFTNRKLPFTSALPVNTTLWPTYSNMIGTCPTPNPLASPYCLSNYPPDLLKAPNSGQFSRHGIYLEKVGLTQTPTATPTYYDITIGEYINPTKLNVFDNLVYGIYALDANVKCYHGVFQNSNPVIILGKSAAGIGINSEAVKGGAFRLIVTPPSPFNNLRKNKFYDCHGAIRCVDIFELEANRLEIRSTQSAITKYSRGKFGIQLISNRFRSYNINDNLIYNISNAIEFSATYGAFGSFGNGQYAGPVNINFNTIKPTASGPITTQFVENGIYLQNIITTPTGTAQVLLPGAAINANGNIITSVYRGVFGYYFNKPPLNTINNNITIVDDPQFSPQYGVYHTDCIDNVIKTNTVVGSGTANKQITDIYTSLNSNQQVLCNSVSNSYQGFEFAGLQPNTKWYGNKMQNNQRGFVLSFNGMIGTQGASNFPIDNEWLGSTWIGTNYQTYTDNSFSINSALYTRTVPVTYIPSNNSAFPPPNLYLPGSSLFPAAGSFYSCSTSPASSSSLRTQIAQDSVIYFNPIAETKHINKNKLYRELKQDPSLMIGNSVLQNFNLSSQTTSRESFVTIEDNLAALNSLGANSLISAFLPTNAIETNYRDFYLVYKNYIDTVFTSSDSLTLVTIAQKCPFTDGAIVYQARALLNLVNNDIQIFSDNCQQSENSRVINSENLNESLKKWSINIFPNPASNELNIISSNSKEDLRVHITDVKGRILANYYVNINAFAAQIKLELSDGIYFINILNSENEKIIKKFIVTK